MQKRSTKALFSYLTDPSLLTNLIACLVIVLGYFVPDRIGQAIRSMGWFALSGAATNWLAVFMLFERIPGLYGSGIIALKFAEFKKGIRNMMMQQFFTAEQVSRFIRSQGISKLETTFLHELVDIDLIFDKLLAAVQSSNLGPLLTMFGGADVLRTSLRQPFEKNIHEAINELASSQRFKDLLEKALASNLSSDQWQQKIEELVHSRLEELTPEMVKNIIQDMIRSHLGWLVVWGGVFGALMGLFAGIFD